MRFLLDEHLRGWLQEAIERYNIAHGAQMDVLAVGDDPSLPLGTSDDEILAWAEKHKRLLITRDKSTLPAELTLHIQSGRHSPGVLILKQGARVNEVIDYLALVTDTGEADDFADRVEWIP